MSVYFNKARKEWMYDFQYRKVRYTAGGFPTKREAQRAEAQRKEDVILRQEDGSSRNMAFDELLLRRMDHIKAYNSSEYYEKHRFMVRRWLATWKNLSCSDIKKDMVRDYLKHRKTAVSAHAANKDLRHLRACFNWGKEEGLIAMNPAENIAYFPEGKRLPYIPPQEDIDKVFALARPDSQDYLWLVRDTIARCGEINNLKWEDVDFDKQEVTLYTRKKRGGHLTPRKVAMTKMVSSILQRRHLERDPEAPWVFWKMNRDPATGNKLKGPYPYRKDLLRGLCERAGVKRFSYHALRHFGASLMDSLDGVSEADIQEVLGHDNRITTHRYLQRIGESKHEAIKAMEQATMKSRLRVKRGDKRGTAHGRKKKSHQKSHQKERSLKIVSGS